MAKEPLHRITEDSHWKNKILLTLLPFAVMLIGVVIWGFERILKQEKARLQVDFVTVVSYLHEQEKFLSNIQLQSTNLDSITSAKTSYLHEISPPADWGAKLYVGQESPIDMPFSMACSPIDICDGVRDKTLLLGTYLADFYATFWASSYFPSAAVFFVSSGEEDVSVSVPSIGTLAGYESINTAAYKATVQTARKILQTHGDIQRLDLSRTAIHSLDTIHAHWFPMPDMPDQMIGLASAGFPPNLWTRKTIIPSDIYLVSLFNRESINVLERNEDSGPAYSFWLINKQNTILMGTKPAPEISTQGVEYQSDGLVWRFVDKSGSWSGIYKIRYQNFFSGYLALPLGALLAVFLALTGSAWYVRWYRRNVITPALDAQQKILDSEAFNKTLIQTAPVGLCVFDSATDSVIFSNSIADSWLFLNDNPSKNSSIEALHQHINSIAKPDSLELVWHHAGRDFSVAAVPTVYQARNVLLCAFSDITTRIEMEQALEQAKNAADEANTAKSLFLSTVSHEIRTPLYGLLGTLELLIATTLNTKQQQYVSRIESSSKLLLQLISDVLDMSKIEAGQLKLDITSFKPLELTQRCVSSYAAMAQQKGLTIFSCIDPEIPYSVFGDEIRISQILNNLISNAIKFTDVGSVIVNVRKSSQSTNSISHLIFEVKDTGIGIAKEHLENLFTPFYLVSTNKQTNHGTGLGLSICKRLAELMGSKIQVRSEHQIGSCFSIELTLQVNNALEPAYPDLSDQNIIVRTPHPALTDNLCAWLERWGANAKSAFSKIIADGEKSDTLLDLFMSDSEPPHTWSGRYISIDPNSGETPHPEIDGQSLLSIGRGIENIVKNTAFFPAPEKQQPIFKLRVLVAEDNPINQMTLRDQLEQLGCSVTIAEDGEDALALWDKRSHDLLLTDVNMPRLNGYELAETLRSEGVRIPIIGITANAMLDEEQRCLNSGMDMWLVKPITITTLISVLRELTPHTEAQMSYEGYSHNNVSTREDSVSVPSKYRKLFLDTMHEDCSKLEIALQQTQAGEVQFNLHRISGALAEVQYFSLSRSMQTLEEKIKIEGINTMTAEECQVLLKTLRDFLSRL